MNYWLLLYFILVFISLGIHLGLHGKEKEVTKYNFFKQSIYVIITLYILYKAGLPINF